MGNEFIKVQDDFYRVNTINFLSKKSAFTLVINEKTYCFMDQESRDQVYSEITQKLKVA